MKQAVKRCAIVLNAKQQIAHLVSVHCVNVRNADSPSWHFEAAQNGILDRDAWSTNSRVVNTQCLIHTGQGVLSIVDILQCPLFGVAIWYFSNQPAYGIP